MANTGHLSKIVHSRTPQPPERDIWWWSLKQLGGTHPIGMLSCSPMLSLVVVDSSVYQTYLHSEFNYGNIFGSFALRSDAEANLLCIQFKYMLIQKKTALLGT